MFEQRLFYNNYQRYNYNSYNKNRYNGYSTTFNPMYNYFYEQTPNYNFNYNNENNTSFNSTNINDNIEKRDKTNDKNFRIGPIEIEDNNINAFGFSIAIDDLILIGLIILLFFQTDKDYTLIIILGLMLFNITFSNLDFLSSL